MLAKRLTPLLLLFSLAGCDQVAALLELPDPGKEAAAAEAEGKAIGSACRHTGRALEDCYALNAKAQKAAIFAGWREMNDYMMQNNMQTVPSQLGQPPERPVSAASEGDIPGVENGARPRLAREDGVRRQSRPNL